MTTRKTIALTRWTFVDKVMSLLFNYSLKAVSRAFNRPSSVGLLCHNYAIIYDCSSFPEGLCHENHCLMYFVGVTFAHSTQEGKSEAVHSVLVRNTWQLQTVHSVVLPALLTTSCSAHYFLLTLPVSVWHLFPRELFPGPSLCQVLLCDHRTLFS